MTPQEIANWKAPEDGAGADDHALKFPPKDKQAETQQVQADQPAKADKPKRQRKQPAQKAKGKKKGRLDVMLGWFVETVPIFEKEDGTLGSDMSKRTTEPVKGAKGVGDLMKYFRNKAATDPDSVTGRAIRFVRVEKVFVAKTRTIVDIEE